MAGEEISIEEVKNSIRQILAKSPNSTCVILMGSALKNKGIQPLLGSIIDFLPSPDEKSDLINLENPGIKRSPSKKEKLLAFAYKVINDKIKGPLVYIRVYSGKILYKTHFLNVSRNIVEKPHHLFRVRANQYVSKRF